MVTEDRGRLLARIDMLEAEVERLRAVLSDYSAVRDALETTATEVCPKTGEDEIAAVRRVVYAELRNRNRFEQAEARLREVAEWHDQLADHDCTLAPMGPICALAAQPKEKQ